MIGVHTVETSGEQSPIRDNQLYSLCSGTVNAGKVVITNGSGDDIGLSDITLAQMFSNVTNEIQTAKSEDGFNAAEKTFVSNNGSLNLANGPIQLTASSSITLPTVRNGYTLLVIFKGNTQVNWSGNVSGQAV